MSAETANKIRDVAHDLIAARGYAGFSYSDVAEIVGLRKASIHHYFPSKADLVVAALREHRSQLLSATGGLNAVQDPLQRLRLYVQYWQGCIESNNRPICIAALLSSELPILPKEVQVEVEAHFQSLSGWVRATLREGVKRDKIQLRHSAEIEAQSFIALVHGAMLSARAYGVPDVFGSITKAAVDRLRL